MTGTFWSMGGYAGYVWPCYAFALLVLAWNLWAARRFHAAARLRALMSVSQASEAGLPSQLMAEACASTQISVPSRRCSRIS